jgi:hypothetical protein
MVIQFPLLPESVLRLACRATNGWLRVLQERPLTSGG